MDEGSFKSTKSNILILASYDSMLPSAHLDTNLNSFKSGVLAQLSLMRSLSKIFRSNGKLKHNIMFYLTASRHNGFKDFKSFLKKPEFSKYTENVEFIIALDSLGKSNGKELEVKVYDSTGERKEVVKRFLDHIKSIHSILSPVNQQDSISFPLLKSDLFGVGIPVVQIGDTKHSIMENGNRNLISDSFDSKNFETNVQILLDSIGKLAFDVRLEEPLFDQKFIDDSFHQTCKAILESHSTAPIVIGEKNLISSELFKIFKSLLKSSKKISTTVKEPKYYSSKKGKLIILDKVSPFLDMYIFVGVLTWLGFIYNVFKKFSILG